MEAASLDNRAGMPFEGGTNMDCSLSGAYSSSEVLQLYEINVRLAKWNFITAVDRLVEKSTPSPGLKKNTGSLIEINLNY